MADEILDKIRDLVEAPIDFEGQRMADNIYTGFLSIVGILSVLVGYGTQNLYNALYFGLAGTAFTFLVVVPPWPYLNRHPVHWLPSSKFGVSNIDLQFDGKKVS